MGSGLSSHFWSGPFGGASFGRLRTSDVVGLRCGEIFVVDLKYFF